MKKIILVCLLVFFSTNFCICKEALSPQAEIKTLQSQIEQHNKNYYELDAPTITDIEYDKLFSHLKYLEQKHPQFASKDSPTQKIGANTRQEFRQIKHKYPLYSLEKINSYDELKNWDKRLKKVLNTQNLDYDAELKIDGLAVSLIYQNGRLKSAATRGDGFIGEDITANAKYVEGIPQKLSQPIDLQVGGEVYMPFLVFENLKSSGTASFSTTRNAAAGSLRQLDENITKNRGLKFFAYGANFENKNQPKTQTELLETLQNLGFSINPETKKLQNTEEAVSFCKTWDKKRFELEYPIDGIVIKVNDRSLEQKLGHTSHAPKWAIAYKYTPEETQTKLTNIELQVGKTGAINPVAIFEPVELGGAKIQRASLHNFDEIRRLDLRIGDKITVKRANEIIPQITAVDKSARQQTLPVFSIPEKCPSCGTKLFKNNAESTYYCQNPDCPAKNISYLGFFASRQAMNIKGLGDTSCEKLIKSNLVKSPSDIYALSISDLNKIGFNEKTAQNLYNSIQISKNQQLSNFITALSIKNVGKEKAKILSENFDSVTKLSSVKKEELLKIKGIDEKIAQNIVDFFKNPQNQKEIAKFKKYDVIK